MIALVTNDAPKDDDAKGVTEGLGLSESEDEELEDIVEDFAFRANMEMVRFFDNLDCIVLKYLHQGDDIRGEKLYLFQFPTPFPTFSSKMTNVPSSDQTPEGKKVSFTADTNLNASSSLLPVAPSEPKKVEHISGVIGQLEMYRSGAVKIRLANGILLNVNFFSTSDFVD
jgi:DNA-directed RNA polymerase III subunit RPC4